MTHLSPFVTFVLLSILKILIVFVLTLTAVAYTVLLERKVLGRMPVASAPSVCCSPSPTALSFSSRKICSPSPPRSPSSSPRR